MPAVQETIDRVRSIDLDQYKYGFETTIEMEKSEKGISEDVIRFISAKKDEPEWMLAWRLDAYKRWQTMQEPDWARVSYDKVDYKRHLLLRGAEAPGGDVARRDRPGDPEDLREARHPAARGRGAGRHRPRAPGRGRRGVRFGLGGHHLQGRAVQGRRDLHADLGGHPRVPGPRARSTSARSCR